MQWLFSGTFVAILALGACSSPTGDDNTIDDDDATSGDDDSSTPEDADGDGWTVEAGDCDDGEPTVHPGADEICDGLDNDCDGSVDEGCVLDLLSEDFESYGVGEDPDYWYDTGAGNSMSENDALFNLRASYGYRLR